MLIATLLARVRYQVVFLIVFAVLMPMLAYQIVFSLPSFITVQAATIIGSSIALLLAYVGYRKLLVFPGISAGGYVITATTISFSCLTALLVLLRVDYSRWQLFSSYILSNVALLLIHLLVERRRHRRFAYIPGGKTINLPPVAGISWHEIDSPEARIDDAHLIVVDLHHEHDPAWEHAIARWVLAGIPVYDSRVAIEQITGRVEIQHIYENTLGSLNPNGLLIKAKSVIDFLIALILLVVAFPVMMLIGLAIRLDSPGPAIFRQERMGFRAHPFTVYKFRTMRVSSALLSDEQARHQAMTQNSDARVTRFGRFLRRSRLDELPQLYNILKGDMSLIGPRPEAISLSKWYDSEIPYYHYRHIIKPGLTGWAQINQGHVTTVDEIREKLHLDFYYVKNYSIWLDILIALRTIAIMITGHGAR
ncbi:exopolysaccharide biosynthesis polyprenyl glycosylphosphotransferase [Sphingomonas sp. RS2018]